MMGIELDLDSLLRMDSASMIKSMAEGVSGGVISPNEARRRIDLKPVTGGESPFLQQQNYSLAALAKRDAQADPFGTAAPEPPPAETQPPPEVDRSAVWAERAIEAIIQELAA
jgi:phage portal protein BeeE